MTPGEQDRHAMVEAMRADDISDTDQRSALNLYDDLMRAAAADSAYSDVETAVEQSAGRGLLEHYLGGIGPTMWTFWKRKSAHDPLRDHQSLTCAHLAI